MYVCICNTYIAVIFTKVSIEKFDHIILIKLAQEANEKRIVSNEFRTIFEFSIQIALQIDMIYVL